MMVFLKIQHWFIFVKAELAKCDSRRCMRSPVRRDSWSDTKSPVTWRQIFLVCKTPVRECRNSCDNDGISLETPVRWEKSLWDDVRFFHILCDIDGILLETLARSKKSLWDDVRCFQISCDIDGFLLNPCGVTSNHILKLLWDDAKYFHNLDKTFTALITPY